MTFINFLHLLRWLFLAITIIIAIPLTLITYYINNDTPYGSTNTNTTILGGSDNANLTISKDLLNIQVFTAANIIGDGLYVYIVLSGFISLIVVIFGRSFPVVTTKGTSMTNREPLLVWRHCKSHQTLVQQWAKMSVSPIQGFLSCINNH